MGQQSEVCLRFSVFRVSLLLPLCICLWTFHNSRTYCLTWGKKKEKKKRKERKQKKPLALFKPTKWVLLAFLDVIGTGGLGFALLPSNGFARIGARSGLQSSQFPSLQLRSSMSCLALSMCTRPVPLIHQLCWGLCGMPPPCSLPAHCGRRPTTGHAAPLSLWLSSVSQARTSSSNQPISLWASCVSKALVRGSNQL